MKIALLVLLSSALFLFCGCEYGASRKSVAANEVPKHDYEAGQLAKKESNGPAEDVSAVKKIGSTEPETVSLNRADSANAASQAIERKIIRDGNLTIEVSSPTDGQRKIFSVAESHGGFVVTSEMTQQSSDDKSKPEMSVNLVVRVPASQFDKAMEEIRAIANRVVQEKRTGKDVTEEFIDLEARMKNQKALEAQFLGIMKRAGKVEDALEVQRQLADVRTEIEKLEGRKRFLENQATLSTINVTLQTPTQIVNAVGFWYSVRSAFADGVDVAAAIVLFLIRAIIALVPILVLIVLPAVLIAKVVINRTRRTRGREKAEEAGAA